MALLIVIVFLAATQRATAIEQCACVPTPKIEALDTNGTHAAYNNWAKDPTLEKLRTARERFILTVAGQLRAHGLSDKDYKYLLVEAKQAPRDEARFARLTDTIVEAAADRNVLCDVSFCSTPPGAVINYQTIGERLRRELPHTLPATTNCKTQLPIGSYYIWTSRDNNITSDKNREIPIINATECVQIQEPK
jgi:hypothetical protein